MARRKKVLSLYESYITRYERGGFLVGDIFKFNNNFRSSEDYKALGQNVKDLIDQMIDSGLITFFMKDDELYYQLTDIGYAVGQHLFTDSKMLN